MIITNTPTPTPVPTPGDPKLVLGTTTIDLPGQLKVGKNDVIKVYVGNTIVYSPVTPTPTPTPTLTPTPTPTLLYPYCYTVRVLTTDGCAVLGWNTAGDACQYSPYYEDITLCSDSSTFVNGMTLWYNCAGTWYEIYGSYYYWYPATNQSFFYYNDPNGVQSLSLCATPTPTPTPTDTPTPTPQECWQCSIDFTIYNSYNECAQSCGGGNCINCAV